MLSSETSRPRVAVVIVNYNSWKDTLACVDSLENVDYKNIRIYVVDNGSTNESKTRLRSINEEHDILFRETNNGYAAGANIGINKAQNDGAEYILLLNNDTRVESNFLSPLVNILEREEEAVAASSVIRYLDSNEIQYAGGQVVPHFAKAHFYSKIQDEEPYTTGAVLGACVLLRAEFIEAVGGLDEMYFFGMDDIDLSYKIVNQGYEIIVHPSSVIYHKGSATAGVWNPFRIYHSTRNRLHFISINLSPIEALVASLYFLFSRAAVVSPLINVDVDPYDFFKYSIIGIYHHIFRREFQRPEQF